MLLSNLKVFTLLSRKRLTKILKTALWIPNNTVCSAAQEVHHTNPSPCRDHLQPTPAFSHLLLPCHCSGREVPLQVQGFFGVLEALRDLPENVVDHAEEGVDPPENRTDIRQEVRERLVAGAKRKVYLKLFQHSCTCGGKTSTSPTTANEKRRTLLSVRRRTNPSH